MSEQPTQIEPYMNSNEELTYSLSHRPIGVVNWVKSLFGYGKTYWFVTNQRVIEYQRVAGGFQFKDVPLEKVTSAEYGRRLNLLAVGLSVVLVLLGLGGLVADQSDAGLALLGLGVLVLGFAYFTRRQVLTVRASGGVSIGLHITRGESVDDFLWYLNTEREKRAQ